MSYSTRRLLSLDVLRGLAVAAMVLVNNPGSWSYVYAPLAHADWHGCTPTDLIAPCFLFVVGVSIVFSIGDKREQPEIHSQIILKALRRMVILFFLGLFIAVYPSIFRDPIAAFKVVRIPGILQRIGIVSFVATILFLKFSPASIIKILLGWLIVYWMLMSFVPVPGIGPANLNKGTNLAAWLDRTLLTEQHLWKAVRTWDPEGVLGTVSAVATALCGILAGILLRQKGWSATNKAAWLFSLGMLAVIVGLVWGIYFPINKNLWTSSYVLYTAGIAAITLAWCYWMIDIQGYTKYTKPVVVFGANAITVFFVSGLLPRTFNLIKVTCPNGSQVSITAYLYKTIFIPYLSPFHASLTWAIMCVLIWMGILWLMYDCRIFIKV